MISRYQYKPINQIWSELNKYQLWLKIELKFLKVMFDQTHQVELNENDLLEIKQIEQRIGHDLAAFIEWLEPKTSNKVHYGLTSSDIIDTAFSVQIKQTGKIVHQLLGSLYEAIEELGGKYDVLVMGRTHGQAAEPLNFFDRCVEWSSTIYWHLNKSISCSDDFPGKLSGSVGDHKYFSSMTEHRILTELGLYSNFEMTQGQIISRTFHAAILQDWALIASSLEKIALDIRLLSQTGIEEVMENDARNRIGSSSMPHKRNPIGCENLCGIARVIRGNSMAAMENIPLWLERDISHSSAERIIFPDSAELLGYMLDRLTTIIKNLVINEDAIKRNIANAPQSDSQKEMLKLIDSGLSRIEAHQKLRSKI